MGLYAICEKIALVEQGLFSGEIDFTCNDKLMMAMKQHPAEELDSILSPVGIPVFGGKEVPLDAVETMKKKLNTFKRKYKVSALNSIIKELEQYLEEQHGHSCT